MAMMAQKRGFIKRIQIIGLLNEGFKMIKINMIQLSFQRDNFIMWVYN